MKQISRKLLVILLAVAAVLSLCAVSVFAGQQAVGVGTVTGKLARIRSGTEPSSPVTTTLDHGTNLSVLGKSGNWYRVKYDDVTGYISDTCIKYVTAAYDLKTTAAVTGDSVAVRSDSSLSSSKIATADKDSKVDVSGFEDGWYRVTYDGQTGYIRSDDLTINGKPAPEPKAVDTDKKTAKKANSNVGVITADEVRLRSSKNAHTDNVIVAMSKGDTVKILKKLDGWYKVAFKIHEGYVSSDFVSVDGAAPVKQTKDTAKKTKADSTKKTKKSEPVNNNDSSIIAVGIVSTDGVRIRKSASTDGKIITSLNKGDAVSILSKKNGWYKVNYDNRNGYMSADYVNAKTSTSKLSTYGLVNTDVLNMRTKPTTDSKRIASFANGMYLDVSGFENGWYKASYGDYSGYVSGDFLTLVESLPQPDPEPVAEEPTANSSNSSSSSSSNSSSSSSNSSNSSSSIPSGGKSAGNGSGSSSDIVSYAEQYRGVPYVWGGASPSGFDCSGFVMYVFNHFGYSLPHSATGMLNYGSSVSKSNLQPGDIVLFHGTGGDTDPASHAGIYIGGNQFIHASSGSNSHCVTVSSLGEDYYASHYLTGRRIG